MFANDLRSNVIDYGVHNEFAYQVVQVDDGFNVFLQRGIQPAFFFTSYATKKSAVRNARIAIYDQKFFKFCEDSLKNNETIAL